MKTQKLLCLLLLLGAILPKANAQKDTTFVDSAWHKIPRAQASFYKLDTRDANDTTRLTTRLYDMKGRLRHEVPILCIKEEGSAKIKKVWDGLSKQWNEAGRLIQQTEYSKNLPNGKSTRYWPDGKIRKTEIYTNGKNTSEECYDKNGKQVDCLSADVFPHYPKGDSGLFEFINNNLHYPLEDARKKVQGTVMVQFSITKEGKIENIRVIRSLSPTADAEACRVAALTSPWIPAHEGGEPIVSQFTLPVTFKLQ